MHRDLRRALPRVMSTSHPIRIAATLAASLLATAPVIAQTPPSGKISDGVVKVGLLLDMSGPYADQTGVASATAAKMAVEDFGGKVLGAPIEVVVADHHDNAD